MRCPARFPFPLLTKSTRDITSCPPLPSSSSFSSFSSFGVERSRGRGRRALISPSAKSKNFTLGCVDAATPLWCFKLLKRTTWAHNDVRASREWKEVREGGKTLRRALLWNIKWLMDEAPERGGKRRGIREKDARTRRVYLVLAPCFPYVVLHPTLVSPFPFSPMLFYTNVRPVS